MNKNNKKNMKWQNMNINHVLLFFAFTWIWGTFIYGDVLLMAREYSFFAFDKTLMYPVWEQNYGTLRLIGRFLLNFFYAPWIGALILSAMLSVCSIILGKLLKLRNKWSFIQYLPAYAYITWITWKGYDAFVFEEPGFITGIPFCCMVTLIVMYLFLISFGKHYIDRHNICEKNFLNNVFTSAVVIILSISVSAFCKSKRDDVCITAKLHRLMWQQEWNKMAETAEQWNGSSRQVAAYHAIAILRSGRLLEDLFKVRYNFKPVHLTSRKGEQSEGREIYEADCNFHAGLVQSAYRNDMEQTTLGGISTVRLRRMIRYAILTDERNLALKYIHILSQQPFEQDFTEKYRMMTMSPSEIKKDEELYSILQMIPADDNFEGSYARPLFIGYYLGNDNITDKNSHDVATAASLYSRMIPLFCYRAAKYAREGNYPSVVADALGMLKVTNPEVVSAFNVPESNIARFMSFAREFNGNDTIQIRQKATEQYDNYKGYSPFYIYFGLPEKN